MLESSAAFRCWIPARVSSKCVIGIRLIKTRVVDLLLALIELFSLGVMAEALREIIGSKSAILLQWGPVDPKFQVEGVAPHQPFFFSINWAKLSFVWYKKWTDLYSILSQYMRVTDGQTDR